MRRSDRVLDRLERGVAQVLAVEDLLAALVDHLALLVHHLVVLEDVLADLEVAVLHGALRALDRLRDHLRLERHVVGEGAVHHPVHGAGGEQPHELVFERQVEAALARVALAARPASQLVVDAAALVALGAEHVEAAERPHVVALGLALALEAVDELLVAFSGSSSGVVPSASSSASARPSGLPPRRMSTPRPAMLVATVTEPGRPAWVTTCASRSCCFAFSTACGMPRFSSRRRELLGLLDRDRADEHGLAVLEPLGDVVGRPPRTSLPRSCR